MIVINHLWRDDDAVSPVFGVIVMVLIAVIFSGIIFMFVLSPVGNIHNEKNYCNSCEQEYIANVTIASTDYGGSMMYDPFYVITTEPFTYEIIPTWGGDGKRMYAYAKEHICQNVLVTYKKTYRGNCEVRTITSIHQFGGASCECKTCFNTCGS